LFALESHYYLSNPGSLGNEKEIIETFLWDKQYYATKGSLFSYKEGLINRKLIGWPLVSMSLLGLGFGLFGLKNAFLTDEGHKKSVFAFIFIFWAVAYYLTFSRYDYQPIRNLFCLLPLLSLLASVGLVKLSNFLISKSIPKGVAAVLVGVVFLSQASVCFEHLKGKLGTADSRHQVRDWLLENYPSGQEVLFFKAVSMSNLDYGKLADAGLRPRLVTTEAELVASPTDAIIVLPYPRESYRSRTGLPDSLEQQGRTLLKTVGVAEGTYFPNVFRHNQAKLLVFGVPASAS